MVKDRPAIEDIENTVFELSTFIKTIKVDSIRKDCVSLLKDICSEYEICKHCYTKIDEVWFDDGLYRHCDCKSKCIVRGA